MASDGGALPLLEGQGGAVGSLGPLLVAGGLQERAELDPGIEAGLGVSGLEGPGIGVTGARLVTVAFEQAAEAEQRPRGHLLVAGRSCLPVHPCRIRALPQLL